VKDSSRLNNWELSTKSGTCYLYFSISEHWSYWF
jgi:hypothetical protein